MLGRGLYSIPNKILPGIYVRGNFKESERKDSIKLYASGRNGDVTVTLTHPYRLKCTDDGNGNVTVSATDGFSLSVNDDGEGNVSMEVYSK